VDLEGHCRLLLQGRTRGGRHSLLQGRRSKCAQDRGLCTRAGVLFRDPEGDGYGSHRGRRVIAVNVLHIPIGADDENIFISLGVHSAVCLNL